MLYKTPSTARAALPIDHPLDRARDHPLLPADTAALAKCLGVPPVPEFETDVRNAILSFVDTTIDGMGWRWMTHDELIIDTLRAIAKGPERALSRIVSAARNQKRRRPSTSDLAVMAFVVHTDINIDLVEEYGADAIQSVELLGAIKMARAFQRRRRKPGRGNRKDENLAAFIARLVRVAKRAGAPNMAANWREKKADRSSRRKPPPLVAFVDRALGMALIRMRRVIEHRSGLSTAERTAIQERIDDLDHLSERNISDRIVWAMAECG